MFTMIFLIKILIKIGTDIIRALEYDNYEMGTEFWLSCLVILYFLQSIVKLPAFIKKLDARATEGTKKSLEISRALEKGKEKRDVVKENVETKRYKTWTMKY